MQERILNGKELDIDIKNAMETLLQEGPTNLKNNLEDWKIKEINRSKMIFYKGKNYIPKPRTMMRHGQNVPRSPNSWTPGGIGNLQLNTSTLLVARTSNICEELRTRLWNVSTV